MISEYMAEVRKIFIKSLDEEFPPSDSSMLSVHTDETENNNNLQEAQNPEEELDLATALKKDNIDLETYLKQFQTDLEASSSLMTKNLNQRK